MPFVSRVEACAYSRATEVLDRVKSVVLNLYPPSTQEFVKVETASTTSHHQTPIVVVSTTLKKKAHCKAALKSILERLSESDKNTLKQTLARRLDENCTLFLRLEKQAAFLGKIQLAYTPDVITVSAKFIQYPRCIRDDVMELITKHLDT